MSSEDLYEEAERVRPPTPPLSDSSTGSAELFSLSFTVQLYVSGGTLIRTLQCDCLSSAGFLVQEVRKWYKKRGDTVAEDHIRFLVGTRPIKRMTTKLFDLINDYAHDLNEPLVVTAVVQHDGLSDGGDP